MTAKTLGDYTFDASDMVPMRTWFAFLDAGQSPRDPTSASDMDMGVSTLAEAVEEFENGAGVKVLEIVKVSDDGDERCVWLRTDVEG